MDMPLTLRFANIGGALMLAVGLLGLFRPDLLARLLSISAVGRLGLAEIRGSLGGLFVALALTVLIAQERNIFAVAGVAWLGAAAGRSFSWWRDGSREARNAVAIAAELLLGYLLLAPVIAVWWRVLFGG